MTEKQMEEILEIKKAMQGIWEKQETANINRYSLLGREILYLNEEFSLVIGTIRRMKDNRKNNIYQMQKKTLLEFIELVNGLFETSDGLEQVSEKAERRSS